MPPMCLICISECRMKVIKGLHQISSFSSSRSDSSCVQPDRPGPTSAQSLPPCLPQRLSGAWDTSALQGAVSFRPVDVLSRSTLRLPKQIFPTQGCGFRRPDAVWHHSVGRKKYKFFLEQPSSLTGAGRSGLAENFHRCDTFVHVCSKKLLGLFFFFFKCFFLLIVLFCVGGGVQRYFLPM